MITSVEKYNFKPFPGSSHSWALKQISRLPKDIKILDVGTGNGAFGNRLKTLGYENLYALEIDTAAKEEARKHYKKVASNIEELNENNFDLILLLDVIEHMTNPEEYLQMISSYTKTGAKILISVPNIAHYSIRLSLLFGYFEYTNRGLLDRTHYSFFTKKRIINSASKLKNFRLESYEASSAPIEYFLPENLWTSQAYLFFAKLRAHFTAIFPGFMAYQHLLCLKSE